MKAKHHVRDRWWAAVVVLCAPALAAAAQPQGCEAYESMRALVGAAKGRLPAKAGETAWILSARQEHERFGQYFADPGGAKIWRVEVERSGPCFQMASRAEVVSIDTFTGVQADWVRRFGARIDHGGTLADVLDLPLTPGTMLVNRSDRGAIRAYDLVYPANATEPQLGSTYLALSWSKAVSLGRPDECRNAQVIPATGLVSSGSYRVASLFEASPFIPRAASESDVATLEEERPAEKPPETDYTGPAVAAGVGAALLAGALFTGRSAESDETERHVRARQQSLTVAEDAKLRDSIETKNTTALLLGALGGAFVSGGVAWGAWKYTHQDVPVRRPNCRRN